MAKKKIVIFMTVDNDNHAEPSGTRLVDEPEHQFKGADETYKVFVNDSDSNLGTDVPSKQAMATAAAHELGHVLSSIFDLPGGMKQDPRQLGELVHVCCAAHGANDEQRNRIRRNERLAWKLARKIYPNLAKENARLALATYEPGGAL